MAQTKKTATKQKTINATTKKVAKPKTEVAPEVVVKEVPVQYPNAKEPAREVLVVIPYLKSGAQGRELEFAIRGWLRHFKEDFKLVVIGDKPNFEFSENIDFVLCPRVPVHSTMCTKHLDWINKIKKIISLYPEYGSVIWACDDIYAVNDFGLPEVQLLKQHEPEMVGDLKNKNRFIQDMARTREALVACGRPYHNYTTHLPYYFDFEKLLELIEKFSMTKTSYVVENLYYNYFFPTRIPLQMNLLYDNLRCGIWRANPRMEIVREAFQKKVWINNSPEGYLPELVKMLDAHYKK